MSLRDFGAGIEQNVHFRIIHQSSEVYPVRNLWSRDFSSAVHESFKDPTPSRSIAVLVISNRANRSYVLTEPKAKGYASECNELIWFQKGSVFMGLELNSSKVKQKSQE